MSTSKTRYDFKMFLGDVLVFRSFLIDEETYYFIDVPNFGVDPSYKQIFLEIIHGEFNLKYYRLNDLEKKQLPDKPEVKQIEGENVLERLEASRKLLDALFGLKIDFEGIQLGNMIAFRFDGHDLNIDYGLNPKSAGDVFAISNELIKTVAANNTNFGEVFQMKEKAGSTIVPFESERIDREALNVVKKAISDINNRMIDSDFAHGSEQYADLYKRFIKQLKLLRRIQDIETFEVIIDNTPYSITDMDLLRDIDASLYNNEVTGIAKIHHTEKFLTSRPNIYSVVVEYMGHLIKFHLDNQHKDFEQMLRVVQESDEKNVRFKGMKVSEEVIQLSQISKV